MYILSHNGAQNGKACQPSIRAYVALRRTRNNLVSLTPANRHRCTLFCIHHAGGGAAVFRNWPRLLGPSIQVGTVVLPGREALVNQPPLTDFAIAVERICGELVSMVDRPYALFGHSLGATLAFEVTCRLEQSVPHAPSCLVVSGCGPVHLKDVNTRMQSGSADSDLMSSTLADSELVQLLHRMGGTPPEVLRNHEMMQHFLPIIRADSRLQENYRWDGRSRSGCSILVLGGKNDQFAKSEELQEWRALTTGEVVVRTFDGGHFFILSREADACRAIAEFLNERIRER